MKFSIVVPVKDEADLIQRTLWSYYAVEPSEVLICTDKPCERNVRKAVNEIAELLHTKEITRIIEIKKSSEWNFHQAHVRRAGFHEAKFDRILTGDIDLVINKNVLKALDLVGKNNVGLASLTKLQYPHLLTDYWRLGVVIFLRKVVHALADSVIGTTVFSGLYALWRPYWLDSEPREGVKKFVNPKQILRQEKTDAELSFAYAGEDTFLRDWMRKKHKCIYLRNVGAIDLGISLESRPFIQYMTGAYFAHQGRSFPVSLGRAFLRAQPYYLKGYLAEQGKSH
jgi:hypothetical protein